MNGFTLAMAIQAITALEARAADFEGRLAAGSALADDVEFVCRDSIEAAQAIRREFGLDTLPVELLPEYAALSQLRWLPDDPDYEASMDRAAAAAAADPENPWRAA